MSDYLSRIFISTRSCLFLCLSLSYRSFSWHVFLGLHSYVLHLTSSPSPIISETHPSSYKPPFLSSSFLLLSLNRRLALFFSYLTILHIIILLLLLRLSIYISIILLAFHEGLLRHVFCFVRPCPSAQLLTIVNFVPCSVPSPYEPPPVRTGLYKFLACYGIYIYTCGDLAQTCCDVNSV